MPKPSNTSNPPPPPPPDEATLGPEDIGVEIPNDGDTERYDRTPSSPYLLDRLLYKGVLPRYAFPTDVATFFVFDRDRSTRFRPEFHFTPSQGLSVALTQYAPGKELWIANKRFTS